ncbi:MAG: hypothetical protein SO415_00050 [Oliverpabstia sp.]|nr:hypothetical protein [Oliverpabstia sp.]
MGEEQIPCQTPLDTRVSQDALQIMKAAIPYMPQKGQKLLAVYAKFRELSNTLSFFHSPQPELSIMSVSPVQPEEMLNDMKKYASDYTRNQIDQLLFALNTIQLLQMYQENSTGGEEA